MSELPSSAPAATSLAKIPFKHRAWRVGKRLLRSLITIYLLVAIVMYLLQTKLIFPGAAGQGTPETKVHPRSGEELIQLKTPDGTLVAGKPIASSALSSPNPAPPPTPPFQFKAKIPRSVSSTIPSPWPTTRALSSSA